MNFGGDHSAPGHGKISPRCVPKLPAMARYRPDAFPKGPRTRKTPVRGNISPACIQIQLILARYACHASEKPRKAPLGNAPRGHLAAKGRFRRPKPSDHARRTNLATLRWTCPCAGAPARATAPRDRPSTAWPLPRGGRLPPPGPRQYLPLAVTPPCSSNSTKHAQLGSVLLPKKRNGARQRIKVWKRQLGFRYKQRLAFEGCASCPRALHKLAAPDEQPKPRQAASCLRWKRLPNVRPDTLRLDRPHTPQPPARCRWQAYR